MVKKISDYSALTLAVAGDLFEIVDISDLTDGVTGTNKKISLSNLKISLGVISNIVEDLTPELGGDLDCLNKNLNNIKLAEFSDWVDNENSGAADTIDFTTGTGQKSTLTASTTYTFTAPVSTTGWARLQMKIVQDATGGFDITFPANVIWDGTEPTWTDGTSNQIMYITFVYDAERDKYIGSGTSWSA